jgi:diguanylate cyclase (GGDEF)-like protein/PAS domain S-box-containing protein
MDGIIIIDEFGVIQGFNPAAEQVFNYKKEEVLGKNVTLLMPDAHRNKHDMAISEYLQTGANDAQSVKARERTALRKGGDIFPIELSASEMRLNGGRFFIGLVRDITERKRDNLRIEQLAHLDFLTRLPNRALFKDRLERAIAMAERNCTKLAVLFLDLDGFKNINDVLGHEAGDQLLCEVASRLTEAVRHADTVARIGGDEFTLILNDVDGCEGAAQVATKILQVLGGTFVIAEQCRQVGASIGISIYPDDARDYDDLLRIADGHMYLAKQQGKNTFRFRPLIAPGSGSAKDGCT